MRRDTAKLIVAGVVVVAIEAWAITSLAISMAEGAAVPSDAPWEVTAYCHRGTRTASGTWPHAGTVAAPRGVPFGAQLEIAGYGAGVVEDRGGAIYGRRLDVWFPTCWQAIQWGRRWVYVTWRAAE